MSPSEVMVLRDRHFGKEPKVCDRYGCARVDAVRRQLSQMANAALTDYQIAVWKSQTVAELEETGLLLARDLELAYKVE